MSLIRRIEKALEYYPEGLTVKQLTDLLETQRTEVYRYIKRCSRVYIDRWVKDPMNENELLYTKSKRYYPVYCVVMIPENCPHPTKGELDAKP